MADAEPTNALPEVVPPAALPVAVPALVPVPKSYKALVDLQYGDRHIKAGETTNDVPANSVKWLVEQLFIAEEVT